jgi:hypothetical protein
MTYWIITIAAMMVVTGLLIWWLTGNRKVTRYQIAELSYIEGKGFHWGLEKIDEKGKTALQKVFNEAIEEAKQDGWTEEQVHEWRKANGLRTKFKYGDVVDNSAIDSLVAKLESLQAGDDEAAD